LIGLGLDLKKIGGLGLVVLAISLNCVALAAVLLTTLIENLELCSSAEVGLFLICS